MVDLPNRGVSEAIRAVRFAGDKKIAIVPAIHSKDTWAQKLDDNSIWPELQKCLKACDRK